MGSGWSSEEEERQPLLGPGLGPAPGVARRGREAAAVLPAAGPGPGRVYGRRWLVLLLFSLLAFAQGLVWNTWGPIQNSARQAYGFSGWDIALLVLWGPIGFLPCFAFMWLLDKRGKGSGTPAGVSLLWELAPARIRACLCLLGLVYGLCEVTQCSWHPIPNSGTLCPQSDK